MKGLLDLKKIYFYYGKAKALEEINLNLEEKAFEAVIGPNGAGKSTLLRVISGLEEPDRGKIEFLGERIDEVKPHRIARKGIAHCPERRRLFFDMTVKENLDMGAYTLKDHSKIRELRSFVYELFPRLKEREQQMLAIARSIMSNPKLLLMDEPSLGLAPKVKEAIFQAINTIKEEGTTILLVEQDAVLAIAVSEYVHVLEEGKIEMRGTKEELEKEPRIKQVYLGI